MSGDQRPGAGPDPELEAAEVEAAVEIPDADTDDAAAATTEPVADVDASGAPPEAPATAHEPATDDLRTEDGSATGEEQGAPGAGKPSGRRTRDPLAAALIGVLTLLLGFAFAVQVRAAGDDQQYAGAREEDLVRILDELNAREARLRDQIADQRAALQQLNSSDSQSAAALEEARARAEAIGILNGTVAAQGPGLVMTIRDADDEVRVSDILDAIQELRGAGAETMEIDGVRVGVSTAVTGTPGSLMVDGRPITSPYEFVVIGSPQNMETALNIPGGVVQDLTRHGASVTITQSEQVTVDALRPLDTPQYASPDTGD
ncbi:DUF881 domain-containing protein [Blastococcus mobilis]|uniref:Uncharacterized conserved protein YlxW, UPF0749 family n=1 Tax=Blastococcus mobilis TaxID=1938746 RepID=A0A238WYQ9_9ACTN|nr:DUF881 domain-containing protein [Blastococcus mobilis]SNR51501.1 Uncharacterized conserved protein YlxW, UPF0749 family [Blastococcus mobilis]